MISDKKITKQIIVKDKKISIWIYGKETNPPILFIHGFFNAFSDYVGDLPPRHLVKDYCIYAFDLPGFGTSEDLTFDKLEFISLVQNKLVKYKKATLFGVSYGGLIALRYYLKYEKKVNALIIAGTPLFFGIFKIYKIVSLFPRYKDKKISSKDLKEFDILNGNNLSKIKVPTLLYYNSADVIANTFMGKRLHKMIPKSQLFLGKNQNHSWLLHRIDNIGLLTKINEFLNSAK